MDRTGLWKGKPVKSLTSGINGSYGRNNLGRITSRHRSAGHKKKYRFVDFKRNKFDMPATVIRFEYDPYRTANIMLVEYEDKTQSYLIAHNILVESAISHAAGVSFFYASILRIGIAFLGGFILYRIYFHFGFLQEKFSLVLEQRVVPTDYYSWMSGQIQNLIYIFCIICVLVFFLNFLKKIGVENLIKKLLTNPLKLMGISSSAINIIIVGLTIGLQFGGGLLIKEAKSGSINKQSILLSLSLLNLVHAVIEDSILMIIIGGHISGVLFFRVIFSLLIVFLILFLYKKFTLIFNKLIFVKV